MNQFYLLRLIMLFSPGLMAQDGLTQKVQEKYLNQVSRKVNKVNNLIANRSTKQLDWLAKQEARMQAKLDKINPEKSNSIFGQSKQKIESLKAKLLQKTSGATGGMSDETGKTTYTFQGWNSAISRYNGGGVEKKEKQKGLQMLMRTPIFITF